MWTNGLKLTKILKPKAYTFGTLEETQPEVHLEEARFKIHKFNIRPRPVNKNHVVIFSCFSEFGSELVGSLYCIPKMLQSQYLGYYAVVMGWKGRAYLYKHLVDEFWELGDEYQWLREYCRAYHHASKNLRMLEKSVHRRYGKVVDANAFSHYTLWELYPDVVKAKKKACWLPLPGERAFASVAKFLKPNSVGVCARYRKCYGRNLQIDFYKKLLDMLQEMGYDPVWFGEKETTYECPYPYITNFRDAPEAEDLENTLALVSRLQFTVQFWTASTRLSGLMGTPFIIFESPDQIYGVGHEGLRLNLCTKGNKKLVISHFYNVYDDHAAGLKLVRKAIFEMCCGNWDDLIGLVDSADVVNNLRSDNLVRIGSI